MATIDSDYEKMDLEMIDKLSKEYSEVAGNNGWGYALPDTRRPLVAGKDTRQPIVEETRRFMELGILTLRIVIGEKPNCSKMSFTGLLFQKIIHQH